MKRLISIGLVLLMSLQCFYNLGVITYFHMNREYIAEVLCINKEKPITICYGQCFLKKNLNLSEEKSNEEGTLPPGKQKIEFPVFLISENITPLTVLYTAGEKNYCYRISFYSPHPSAPFHPPTIVS